MDLLWLENKLSDLNLESNTDIDITMTILQNLELKSVTEQEYVWKHLMHKYRSPTVLNRSFLTKLTQWYLNSACNICTWTTIRKQSTYGGFQCIEKYLRNETDSKLLSLIINALVISSIPPLDSIYEKNALFEVYIMSVQKNNALFSEMSDDYVWTPEYIFNTVGQHDLTMHKTITIANISLTYALYEKTKKEPENWRECKKHKNALDQYVSGMDLLLDDILIALSNTNTPSETYAALSKLIL